MRGIYTGWWCREHGAPGGDPRPAAVSCFSSLSPKFLPGKEELTGILGKLLENANEEAALSGANSRLRAQTPAATEEKSCFLPVEESPAPTVLHADSSRLSELQGRPQLQGDLARRPALPRLTHPTAHCGEDKSGLFHPVGVTLVGKRSLRGWPSFGEVPIATPPQPSLAFPSLLRCGPRRMSCSRGWKEGLLSGVGGAVCRLSLPAGSFRSAGGVRGHGLLGAAFLQWLSNTATEVTLRRSCSTLVSCEQYMELIPCI